MFRIYDKIFCEHNQKKRRMLNMYKTIKDVLKEHKREDILIAEHVADPHVGFDGNPSKYNEFKALKVEKRINGLNARTVDVNNAFKQTVDIALNHLENDTIDIYLNAGDGFDKVGYRQNFIETFYVNQYLRLTKQGIPVVEIVGNHNLPLQESVGVSLERIGLFDNIYTAYKGKYERFDFDNFNLSIHCVPSSFNQPSLDASLDQVERIEGRINIGIGHFGVSNIKHYVQSADSSLVVDLDRLIECKMDYFALGDYHKATDLGHNIHYAGAIERLGFDEIDNKPRVNLLAFNKKTGELLCIEPVFLDVRPMLKREIDAKGKTIEAINNEIIHTLQSDDFTDSILILKIYSLPSEQKRLICHKDIAELTKDTLAFKLDIEKVNTFKDTRTTKTATLGVLDAFPEYAKKIPEDGSFDKEKLIATGLKYLREVLEDEA